MKCLQNVEFDDLVFLECIYPRLTMDNTAVSAVGLMGAGKLRAGVRVRALKPLKYLKISGPAGQISQILKT